MSSLEVVVCRSSPNDHACVFVMYIIIFQILSGGLIQHVDRDTQKCAYKCSHAVVNGKEVNVFKSPITDLGKKSKKGRLTLEIENGQFVTKEEGTGSSDKVQQFMYM